MKTSIFNGLNTGRLDFDYNIRYRPRINVTPLSMNRQIQYLFKGVDYEHICYVWENDKGTNHKHSHSLIKTSDNNLIMQLQENLKSNKEPIIGEREILIREIKNLVSPTTGEILKIDKHRKVVVEHNEIRGKHGVVYVEPVLSNISSSIYTHKFTDYGSNFGYIIPYLTFQTPL
jgi:hypothetical protein